MCHQDVEQAQFKGRDDENMCLFCAFSDVP